MQYGDPFDDFEEEDTDDEMFGENSDEDDYDPEKEDKDGWYNELPPDDDEF